MGEGDAILRRLEAESERTGMPVEKLMETLSWVEADVLDAFLCQSFTAIEVVKLNTDEVDMAEVVETAEQVLTSAMLEQWRLARDGPWTAEAAGPHVRQALALSTALQHIHRLLDVEEPTAEVEASGQWGTFVTETFGHLFGVAR